MDAMDYPSVRTVAIIAKGVPEQQTKLIIKMAEEDNASSARHRRQHYARLPPHWQHRRHAGQHCHVAP
eukprot:348161-Heterocapsa_arctica.AAC.1